ncbi:MAG TPA: hypothetical protein V6D03_05965 [Candidatus Caenarcaniphilales bacterium]
MQLGKVVKSNSHCDYVVQLDDAMEVLSPPQPEDYGFGCFVKLETEARHWAVGLVYNSQLFNPMYLNTGPRLLSEPDPLFTPDLIRETRTLLWTVLVGTLEKAGNQRYGQQGIPRVVVPVNTPVSTMDNQEVYSFHLNRDQQPQFCYYSHLLKAGGSFANQLLEQILKEISPMFTGSDRRALEILGKELSWKHTVGIMR